MEKKYVDNDVFVFRVQLDLDKDITIYTKPFGDTPIYKTNEEYEREYRRRDDLVESKYFTKERIEELKNEFIEKIRKSDNPFHISCVDWDGGYNVTEDQLLSLE